MLGEQVFKVDFLFIDIFVQEPCVFFFIPAFNLHIR